MPDIALTHPWYLLLLAPAAGAAYWLGLRGLAGLTPERRRVSFAVRLTLLTALVLALAGPTVSFPSNALQVLFLLDRSASVSPEAKAQQLVLVRDATRSLPAHAQAGTVVFGRDAMLETTPARSLAPERVHSAVQADGSAIDAAMRLGMAYLPTDVERRLVLVTDGNQTTPEALNEAAAAAASGVEIDVVPIEYHYPSEVLLDKLEAPERAKKGEPLEVRVVARSTAAFTARLRLLRDGVLVAESDWLLRPGINSRVLQQTLVSPGFHRWEALLETAGDSIPDNNRVLGFTHVQGEPRVLMVEGRTGDGALLASTLRARSLKVELRSVAGLPGTLAGISDYDSLVMVNVRADQVSEDQMRLVQSAVRDLGVGLVTVGGEQALTAGGWRGTPVEEALPLEMQAPRRRETAEMALVLVIDSSGSMGSPMARDDQMAFAKRAAQGLVGSLRRDDELGVVAFSDIPQWIVPLKPLTDPTAAMQRIEEIMPGGGTNMYPALESAFEALLRSRAAVKHILVLTDGHSSGGNFLGLTDRMQRSRVSLATVGVGNGADGKLLSGMAERAGGRYYAAVRWTALPHIFEREVRLASRAALVEEPFRPQVAAQSELLRGLTTPPALLGYVATKHREAASVEVPLRSHRGDPLVATWRYGLGRSAVVTSDAKARWAAPWVADGTGFYSAFWTRLVRSTLRSTAPDGLNAAVTVAGGMGVVQVDALTPQGAFRNGLALEGRVAGPDGGQSLRLLQIAPGRYEGRFPADARGQYLVSLRGGDAQRPGGLTIAGAAVPYSPEYRSLESNQPLIRAIAERTGGQVLPALGPGLHGTMLPSLFRRGKPARTTPVELWPGFLLSGILLLPLDVGLRRVALSRAELTSALLPVIAAVAARLSGHRPATGPHDEGMGRLLLAKGRTRGREQLSAPKPIPPETPLRSEPMINTPRENATREPSGSGGPPGDPTRRLLRAKYRATESADPPEEKG